MVHSPSVKNQLHPTTAALLQNNVLKPWQAFADTSLEKRSKEASSDMNDQDKQTSGQKVKTLTSRA